MNSEKLLNTSKKKNIDDMSSLFSVVDSKKIKISIFIAFLFILVTSSIYQEKILAEKYIDGDSVNTKGVIVQAVTLSIFYVILHILVEHEYL